MAKKHKPEEPEKENSERWLLTYSDMITLLMLFFIVLYSMSNVNPTKYQELSQALEEVFSSGNFGLYEGMSPGAKGILESGATKITVPRLKRQELIKRTQVFLKDFIKGNEMAVGEYADGVKITLFSDVFFKTGSAELSYDAAPALAKIADMLSEIDNKVRIEGNTDDTANYGTDQTDLNWDLSASRSLNVLKYLQMIGVDGKRMIAVANGSAKPEKSNSTAEGRSFNRRVDLIVLF